MPEYRRLLLPAPTYFFTVVTERRRPVLVEPQLRRVLREAVAAVRQRYPFRVDGWVLLPDHMHCLWTLPPNDRDYARRWSIIKRLVTQGSGDASLAMASRGSRQRRREGGLWQRRFWEHAIRDEADRQRHLDYCYWNPVRHGLVGEVSHWPYSTFHRDVARGLYPRDWGGCPGVVEEDVFGE